MSTLKHKYQKIPIFNTDAKHLAFTHLTVCLIASAGLLGCLKAPDEPESSVSQDSFEVTAPLQKTETVSAEVCAAKIEMSLKSRRQAVEDLPYPKCGESRREWNDGIDRLMGTNPEFPCMNTALRNTYGVAEGSNLVPDRHALSPERAFYSFGNVNEAICNKPYIAIARDTKRSVEKVVREPGFDSVSEVRSTLELVESLRGDLPPIFDVVQVIGGDYSNLSGRSELETLDETAIWTFCKMPDGNLYSIRLDNKIYDGPGGLELLRTRLAQADEWTGDDSCPADWARLEE